MSDIITFTGNPWSSQVNWEEVHQYIEDKYGDPLGQDETIQNDLDLCLWVDGEQSSLPAWEVFIWVAGNLGEPDNVEIIMDYAQETWFSSADMDSMASDAEEAYLFTLEGEQSFHYQLAEHMADAGVYSEWPAEVWPYIDMEFLGKELAYDYFETDKGNVFRNI